MISGAVLRCAGAAVKGGSGGCPDHTDQDGGGAGWAVEAILRAVMRAWDFSFFSGHVFPSGTDRAGWEPPSRGKGGRPVPGPDRGSTDRESCLADRDRRAKGNPARLDHGGGKGIAGVRPKRGAFDRVHRILYSKPVYPGAFTDPRPSEWIGEAFTRSAQYKK
jgi:hypothetical protein